LRNSIKPDKVLLTAVGLHIPAELSFEDWERAGRRLSGIVDSSTWCLGDWLVYGKLHYSDRYKRAIDAAGLQYQTLRNYAWVSHRFELSRRRPNLTFQHHAEVASLPPPEQDLWLDRAEQGMWTTKQLRMRLQAERIKNTGETGQLSTIPRIEVPEARLIRWYEAAEQAGVEFKKWVTDTLDGAAGATDVGPDRPVSTPQRHRQATTPRRDPRRPTSRARANPPTR
jgi:hypothetical protein